MTDIEFEPATHTYTLEGKVVPSVSQIIKPARPWMRESDAMEAARERGNRIHAYAEELNNGFDPDVLPEDEPYVEGYLKFLSAMPLEVVYSELRVAHVTYKFAGTVDLVADFGDEVAVVDYKTGITGPWDGLQLAGYAGALANMSRIKVDGLRAKRMTLSLPGNGTWKLIEHTDATGDWTTFLSLLNFHNWKGKHQL